MEKAKMLQNDEGQMIIDYLFGLVIFLVAVLYLVMTIPGIFLPYQNNAVDLSSVAYRTSALLVEDPGYYQYDIYSGTQWEQNMGHLQRIGLAESDSASSKSITDVLSKDKIEALSNLPYNVSRDKLGLNNSVQYDYNLTITWINNSTGVTAHTTDVINGITPNAQNVETIQRPVLIDEGKRLLVDGSHASGSYESQLVVNVTRDEVMDGNTPRDVTLTIFNAPAGNIYIPTIDTNFSARYGLDKDYAIYINNVYVNTPPVTPVPAGSRVDIVFNGTTLTSPSGFLHDNAQVAEIAFLTSMPVFNGNLVIPVRVYDTTNPLYCSLYDKALINLKVWS